MAHSSTADGPTDSPTDTDTDVESEAALEAPTGSEEQIITYTCGHGAEHAIPSDEVRVMAWGATGFEVACCCGPEPLADANEEPHEDESLLHVASIRGDAPSPAEWLALEDVRDGWFHENPWRLIKSRGKTPMEMRASVHEGIEGIADDNDRSRRGGADETDTAARGVECPDCGAGEGEKCQRPSGHRVRRSHAARKDAAGVTEEETAPETVTNQTSLEGWST